MRRAVLLLLLVIGSLPATARADDWRKGPTDPLYLAVGLLSSALDFYTPAGTYVRADGWLALFGMRRENGFFERGAYVGLGAGYIFGTLGYGATFHHPIIQLAEGVYLGGDLTCTMQVVTACAACPGCGCHDANLTLQIGLELVAFD